ncbi:inactive protein RESTRICTED TEV MOVEMENT 2-like [Telopea speciosissima]|uniref:inactive protein RESTRICTED TEV MOVEMENT 2-like n=1 Tax=Telopea speciosissima TaxID=54955 RepID=UPI001CC34778|nr:inactive protein RESTRICTED TEV MOVEMENT 2-like [Telopea speciosissima]
MAQPSAATRTYEDFQPSSNWAREEGSDTFIINLPDFKRDQLRIQIDGHGQLKVTGERPLTENKWSRFRKDFFIPNNCNEKEIKAKFANGVLHITMPKTITQISTKDEAMPKQQETPNQGEKKIKEDDKKEMKGIDGKLAGEGGDSAGKMMIGSKEKENRVLDPQKQTISYRFGMGISFRFKQPTRAIVNVAIGIAVVVALGVYAKYRLQHSVESET